MDPKLTTKPAALTFILICWILTGLWPFGRPVSATTMLRVRFTNRRKEKLHPAPNVVMRPRRPKTSACPVRKHQSGFPVKQLFGEVVTDCLRNEFRKHTKKRIIVECDFGKCFFFLFFVTFYRNILRIDVAVISYFLNIEASLWSFEETDVIDGWLLWLFPGACPQALQLACYGTRSNKLLCYISIARKLDLYVQSKRILEAFIKISTKHCKKY